MYDIIIKDGKVIDGAGNPWFYATIGIKDGKIKTVGVIDKQDFGNAKAIDAKNMIVCPGFIDMHSHADFSLLMDQKLECLVRQGITTCVTGNCGSSIAPLSLKAREYTEQQLQGMMEELSDFKVSWLTFKEYLEWLDKQGSSINVVPLVGLDPICMSVLEGVARQATSEELERMKEYIEEAMQAGAFGMSTGLIYAPQMYTSTEEIIELAKVVGKYKGLYFSHIRNEGDEVVEAIQELIDIVEKSGCMGGQIAHHKIAGPKNWGKSKDTLQLITEANERGLNIRADQYPYIRGMNSLVASLPGWAREGKIEDVLKRLQDPETREKIKQDMLEQIANSQIGWDKIFIARVITTKWKDVEGLSIDEITQKKNRPDCFTTFCEIILDDEGRTRKLLEYGSEEDIQQIMRHQYIMIGTDAHCVPFGRGKPHPRFYGTYPKILGKYVRKEKVLVLEQAIRKMTSFPAQTLHLFDRGLLREGMWGDMVIFNPKTVIDKATYLNPHQYPVGIHYVLVNGQVVIENDHHTGQLAGKILRHS
ncbi:MAG: amidohydrolase family protein [Promethearchaeota archaeon]